MFICSVCPVLAVRAFGRLPYEHCLQQIADTWGFAETLGCPHTDVVGVLISLEAEEMLKSKMLQTMYFVVSSEGQRVGSCFLPVLPFSFFPFLDAGFFSIFACCFSLRSRNRTRERSEKQQAKMEKKPCLLYTSPSPRDATLSRMPSSA